MNSFDHIVLTLNRVQPDCKDVIEIPYTANPDKIKITLEQWNTFLKECIFDKLKGTKLADSFREKFNIKNDILLSIKSTDEWALDYIKTHYIK